MASRLLVITIKSVECLKAHGVYLVVSLSGDESYKKQCTPVHKKGSTPNPWFGHTFEFTVEEAALLDTRLEFKIEKKNTFFCFKKGCFFGRKTTYVVGKVDVPVEDLRPDGSASDMNPKVLSCEVRSSSPKKTKGKTMAVLEFSYEFGEQFLVEAPPDLEEVTVTTTEAAERHQTGNATPPPPQHHPGRNFLERVGIAAIASVFSNLVFGGE
ncbi:uncharacterized protein LOC125315499 [Rhodamnia argentea]|uniref:Uncharacterized protein LOC125315499 n=1 Tax=Rhodamnia argentea TaxID=178133 RepID=A0ABM3HJ35_9MYRT|nr:uncharacterized protein LOC125315499 [Rhodamnia argentea]